MADNQVYLRWCVPWFPRIGGWLRQSRWPEKERQPGGAMSQAEQEMRSRAWLRGTRSDFRRLRSLVKVLSPQASGRTFGSARGVMLGRGDIRIHFFLFFAPFNWFRSLQNMQIIHNRWPLTCAGWSNLSISMFHHQTYMELMWPKKSGLENVRKNKWHLLTR